MRSTLALAAVLALLVPEPARACWDGYAVDTGDGIRFTGGDESWSASNAVMLGSWALRYRALLGDEGTLEIEFGWGEASVGEQTIPLERASDPRALFDRLADALAVPSARRARLLAIDARPYAVQVAASRDRARAEHLAMQLSESELPFGFYEAGGFPADNAEAHVVEGIAADGQPVFRIVVGAFLDRASAAQAATEIARVTGRTTSLRALRRSE
jgi:hypothetical protein